MLWSQIDILQDELRDLERIVKADEAILEIEKSAEKTGFACTRDSPSARQNRRVAAKAANTNTTSRLRSLCIDMFLLGTVAMSLGGLLYILLGD